MLTEEQNRYVSDQVYLLDSSRADKDKRLIENKILSFEDKKPYLGSFQVLKVEDNQENGMQAMAVAPIGADGQPDYSQSPNKGYIVDAEGYEFVQLMSIEE